MNHAIDVTYLKTFDYRVCNSNGIKSGNKCCLVANFIYDEICIAPSNWESSIVNSCIMHIILSEMLHIPIVIENGNGVNGPESFYDSTSKVIFMDLIYESRIHKTLVEADRVGGNFIDTIEPCAHVLPEVWEGGTFGFPLLLLFLMDYIISSFCFSIG